MSFAHAGLIGAALSLVWFFVVTMVFCNYNTGRGDDGWRAEPLLMAPIALAPGVILVFVVMWIIL